MTVRELFNRFTRVFSKIKYDNKLNITEGEISGNKYIDFLSKYGERKVDDWFYDNRENLIYISI